MVDLAAIALFHFLILVALFRFLAKAPKEDAEDPSSEDLRAPRAAPLSPSASLSPVVPPPGPHA